MDLWYQQLKKPFWAPSEKLFGPVWSILYVGIFITFAAAVYLFIKSQISLLTLLPFILNLMFNLAFTLHIPGNLRIRSKGTERYST